MTLSRNRTRFVHFTFSALVAVAALAGDATAQKGGGKGSPAAAGDPSKPPGTGVKIERGASGKKVYRITEEIRIEGKIQKPEAFYVLQKSSINYDWQEL